MTLPITPILWQNNFGQKRSTDRNSWKNEILVIIMTLEKAFDVVRAFPKMKQEKVINFVVSITSEDDMKKCTDIADSGLGFGPEYTDENHDERMARALTLAKNIEIDEQAIKDLRQVSMI